MADSLAVMIQERARRFAGQPAMRYQVGDTWRSISYRELGRRVRTVASALVDSGVEPGDFVGIFSPNRPEWTIADLAVLSVRAVTVPIYATSTAQQAAFIVNDADVSLLFVGDQEQYDKVVEERSATPRLGRVVTLDDTIVLRDDESEHFEDLVARGARSEAGREVDVRSAGISADDLATVVYTSGTTGEPKGALLTHGNFAHQFRALDERFAVGPGDTSLCFLPLSHVYERAWTFYVLSRGAENCYVLDPRRVVEALAEVRPTLMVSVPRLYEKIADTVRDRVQRGSAVQARLFSWAMSVGSDFQHARADGRTPGPLLRAEHAVADRLVLAKIRDVLGGDKKVLSAGGAPLAKDIEEFFFSAGLLVCQGYGLTETTALATCNHPGGFRFGTVGTPVRGTEIRIAGSGEIQVRGGSVMKGYLGRPEDSSAAFDEGWFRTGDVGAVDADGFLTVTDRIKDIIITAQGKNVAPQHVEAVLASDPYIEQVAVIGDRRPYLSALIVPAFELLERYADESGISYSSREDLVACDGTRALYDRQIASASAELAGYEQVKRYTLLPRGLTQERGELTPTLKLKRRVVEAEYADVIDSMYEQPRAVTNEG